MTLLILDIGGSAIKSAYYENEQLTALDAFPTPKTREELVSNLKDILQKQSIELSGIAISCPGDIDEESGMVNGTSFVPFLHFTPFLPFIQETFGCPVSLYNDAQSAALAEMRTGVGSSATYPLFVIIGSGIGVALARDGEVISSFDSLEEKSEKILIDIIRSINGISASPVQSAKIFSLKKFELPSTYDGKDVFELAEQQDEQALQQVDTMYTSLAHILVLLNHVVAPEFIALGGGITNHPTFLEDINKRVKSLLEDKPMMLKVFEFLGDSEPQTFEQIDLKLCQYKSDANLYGALYHFLDKYKQN